MLCEGGTAFGLTLPLFLATLRVFSGGLEWLGVSY
jgi:hypothetical protein